MDDISKLHAKIAKEAYENKRSRNIDDYEYQPHFSNDKLAVYRNRKANKSILGIRGTNLRDMRDITDDIAILKDGHKANTPHFKKDEDTFRKLKKELGNGISVTGHSRGGVSARKIADKYNIDGYTFNEPFTPKSLLDNLKKKKNIKSYRTQKDVLSIFNPNSKIINSKKHTYKNAHGINNFLK